MGALLPVRPVISRPCRSCPAALNSPALPGRRRRRPSLVVMGAPTVAEQQLRSRARELRRLARRLADSEATQLHQRAGADTWVGPTAQRCLDELYAVRRHLLQAHDDLVTAATGLDRKADQLAAAHPSPPRWS